MGTTARQSMWCVQLFDSVRWQFSGRMVIFLNANDGSDCQVGWCRRAGWSFVTGVFMMSMGKTGHDFDAVFRRKNASGSVLS